MSGPRPWAIAKVETQTIDVAELGSPDLFMQWKGTDVCLDLHCPCGAHCHLDGFFAYTIECGGCGAVWKLPDFIIPERVENPEDDRAVLASPIKDDVNLTDSQVAPSAWDRPRDPGDAVPEVVQVVYTTRVYAHVDVVNGTVTSVHVDDENIGEGVVVDHGVDADVAARAVQIAEQDDWPGWSFGW